MSRMHNKKRRASLAPAEPSAGFAPAPEQQEKTINGKVCEITRRPLGGALLRLDNGARLEVPRGLAGEELRRGAWVRARVRGGSILDLRVG